MTNRLLFSEIISLAHWWKDSCGNLTVEIAALEPMLWKEKDKNICDVVKELKSIGFVVTMTTNGSLLEKYADSLKKAELDLLRISWHSMDSLIFNKITGGGNLKTIERGVIEAINVGLPIKINRVLLKGFTFDLGSQIDFIDKYKLKIKLLDLYWTPSSASHYSDYYISPQEALFPFISKLGYKQLNELTTSKRKRYTFQTQNGGSVEYKIKETAKKTHTNCLNCSFITECLEGYGDYFRVFPDKSGSLCYLRKDLQSYDFDSILQNKNMPLRLVLEGRCNFNCGFPNSASSWCLKQDRGFLFPNRNKVIRLNHE